MFGFQRLSIQSKMILLFLAVALSSLAVMAWIGYQTGKTALERTVANQLRGIQVAKTSALKTKLESLRIRPTPLLYLMHIDLASNPPYLGIAFIANQLTWGPP
jgi:hypothetical protein